MADRRPPAFGTLVAEFAGSALPALLHSAGLRFAVVDCEHGSFDPGQVTTTIAAARTDFDVYVRTPVTDRSRVLGFLDAGAAGIVAPMISTRADCERLVEHTKYPPLGRRGVSTFRAHTGFSRVDPASYLEHANRTVRCFGQIETARGLALVDTIASVPGLDGLVLGPNDLLADLGAPGRYDHPVLAEAVAALAAAGRDHGLTVGVMTSDRGLLTTALAHGFHWIAWSSDSALLHRAARDAHAFLATKGAP
ncbi:HpcH/HpaI aldolase family protein [Micromonospora cathayae]|uniref:Aldolase/citrate lyase family protein n=1 Tax=Micromonospora cathayae TaxID=3028804 RepID=A0ABY7ZXY4_9ACTN|nr:aldolase/citrate lyase family protein [Micromonospora sp. HUAS 3]WDZ87765.1 aldolase/citrate lyase family protein [Micromonospora sp. HUAS 3]